MSYKNWSEEAQVAADMQYISKRDFVQALNDIGTHNWSIVDHRQQMMDIWGSINRNFIVNETEQFPKGAVYISLEMVDYAKLEAQLMAALSYKESSKHRNEPEKKPESASSRQQIRVSSDTGHTEGTIISYSSDDDARKACYEAIRTFKVQISRPGGTVGRSTFEARYRLKWE
jgi:hypothetical protein